MGRRARLKRERRHANRTALPPCSFQKCPNGQPPGTHLLVKKDGSGMHYSACESCVDPMMHVLKLSGIDAQVITYAAMRQLNRVAKSKQRAGSGPASTPPPSAPETPPGNDPTQ